MKRNSNRHFLISKRIKLVEPHPAEESDDQEYDEDEKELKLMDINDDCISNILKYLPLKDLCSMSVQCARLRNLALGSFRRNCTDESIDIYRNFETVPEQAVRFIKPKNDFLPYFTNGVRNIRIFDTEYLDPQHFFNFLAKKCCEHLLSLELDIGGAMVARHGKIIENQLKHVEKLSIQQPHIQSDTYNVLLKHCEYLKHLDIYADNDSNLFWLQQNYRKLESLKIRIEGEANFKQFDKFGKSFFERHPKIKIICEDTNTMKAVLRIANNIEQLIIETPNWFEPFDDIIKNLMAHCEKTPIKYLELITTRTFCAPLRSLLSALNDVQKVQRIHRLKLPPTNFQAIPLEEYEDLAGIYSLDLGITSIMMGNMFPFRKLSQNLTNLEELYMFLEGNGRISFQDFMMDFCQNCPKLKRIVIGNVHLSMFSHKNTNLFELNQIRESIPNACAIAIELFYRRNYEGNIPRLQYLGDTCKLRLKFQNGRGPHVGVGWNRWW